MVCPEPHYPELSCLHLTDNNKAFFGGFFVSGWMELHCLTQWTHDANAANYLLVLFTVLFTCVILLAKRSFTQALSFYG